MIMPTRHQAAKYDLRAFEFNFSEAARGSFRFGAKVCIIRQVLFHRLGTW
jgi:hypothetical protein